LPTFYNYGDGSYSNTNDIFGLQAIVNF
jgi:hypothetical protein